MNNEHQMIALGRRQLRLERVFAAFLLEPAGSHDTKDEVRRGYMEAKRHAMAEPPGDQSAAFDLGYFVKKMEEG